jgi:hypothetical protein
MPTRLTRLDCYNRHRLFEYKGAQGAFLFHADPTRRRAAITSAGPASAFSRKRAFPLPGRHASHRACGQRSFDVSIFLGILATSAETRWSRGPLKQTAGSRNSPCSLPGNSQARQIGAHDDVAGESARLGSLPEIGCGQRTGHLVGALKRRPRLKGPDASRRGALHSPSAPWPPGPWCCFGD